MPHCFTVPHCSTTLFHTVPHCFIVPPYYSTFPSDCRAPHCSLVRHIVPYFSTLFHRTVPLFSCSTTLFHFFTLFHYFTIQFHTVSPHCSTLFRCLTILFYTVPLFYCFTTLCHCPTLPPAFFHTVPPYCSKLFHYTVPQFSTTLLHCSTQGG